MHIQLPFPILLIHNKTDEWLSFLPQPSLVPWTSQVNRIALLTCSDHGPHPYNIGQKLYGSRWSMSLSGTYFLIPGPPLYLLSWLGHVLLLALTVLVTPQVSPPSLLRTLVMVECFKALLELAFHIILYLFSCTDVMKIFLFGAVISSLESTSQHILPPLFSTQSSLSQ